MVNSNKIKIIILIFLLIFIENLESFSQTDSTRVRKIDSTYIFKPAQKVKEYNPDETMITSATGLEIAFSNSGLGFGFFYHSFLDNENILFGSFYISGARNTDEFEIYDSTGNYSVPNKINRLFLIPFTIGYSRILFSNSISGSFRPFVSVGFGPSLIFSTPYEKGWFEAWSYNKTYVKFGGFIGIGGYFRSIGNSVATVGIKYYYIPFGEPGLESIKDLPITNFGGVVLSLSIGFGSK